MEHRGQALGPAGTRFNDYIGTVAADDAEAIKDRPSLYELAQIDRDRFTIVAIDLKVDGPTTATVYAIDHTERAVVRPAEIVERGKTQGEIPVMPFDIPETDRKWPSSLKGPMPFQRVNGTVAFQMCNQKFPSRQTRRRNV